jgi:hypothetical protein
LHLRTKRSGHVNDNNAEEGGKIECSGGRGIIFLDSHHAAGCCGQSTAIIDARGGPLPVFYLGSWKRKDGGRPIEVLLERGKAPYLSAVPPLNASGLRISFYPPFLLNLNHLSLYTSALEKCAIISSHLDPRYIQNDTTTATVKSEEAAPPPVEEGKDEEQQEVAAPPTPAEGTIQQNASNRYERHLSHTLPLCSGASALAFRDCQ